MNSLKPLDSGNVLLVGVKASNFGDEIRMNPRVIMWDSQNEHWLTKEIPQNVRAVFITRFVGHDAFRNIMSYARKKRITVFNPQGTGMIAKQVGELLAVSKPVQNSVQETIVPTHVEPTIEVKEEPMSLMKRGRTERGKLLQLIPFIDKTLTRPEIVDSLFKKSKELGISTTRRSIESFYYRQTSPNGNKPIKRFKKIETIPNSPELDVSVQILDSTIKGLQDVRQYLIEVTKENQKLKNRLARFKELFNE